MKTDEITITGFTEYVTSENDTFDLISFKKYGNEFFASLIIEYNRQYADVILFDAGVALSLPEVDITETEKSLPPWRQNDGND